MKLAVVVQKMVSSEVAGVMFTVDPSTQMPNIIIEAGYGLGEALVSGRITPDTYIIDKEGTLFQRKAFLSRPGS